MIQTIPSQRPLGAKTELADAKGAAAIAPAIRFSASQHASGMKADQWAPALRFGKQSVNELSAVQTEFTQRMQHVASQATGGQSSEEYVRELERARKIPREVYDAVVANGLTVVGVPIPDREAYIKALADNPELVQELTALKGDDFGQQMQALPDHMEAQRFIDRLGAQGHAMPQALAAANLARQMSVGVATALGVNSGLAAEAISKTGTDAQKALWLNLMQEGQATFAYGLTEEKTGSDPRSITTTWKQDAEGNYVLNGDKKFIGGMANVTDEQGNVIQKGNDFMVTFAVDDPTKPPEQREFRAFVVPRDAIGEENIERTGEPAGKTGLNEVNNGTIKLKNVKVPKAFMLGKGEDIYPFLLKSLDETRLFVGAMSLGTTQATLDTIQQYVRDRVQNGHPIGEFQPVAFPLRKNAADAEAARLLIMNTARKVDDILQKGERSEKFRTDTAMSKLFCSELARRTTEDAVQAMGGNGFIEDANGRGIPKRLRDAKVLTIYEGTSNIQRNLITMGVMVTEGKALLKTAKGKAIAASLRRHPGRLLGTLIKGGSPVTTIATSLLEQKKARGQAAMQDAQSSNPMDVIEAAYQYAVGDNMLKYQAAEKEVKAEWAAQGTPAKYDGWDEKSLERERGMEALNPVQMRMHIMADIAVDRHLAGLVRDELAVLAEKGSLPPAEQNRKELLEQFLKQAKERSIARYQELRGDSLENLEQDHTATLAATETARPAADC